MPRLTARVLLAVCALVALPAPALADPADELEREGVRDIVVTRDPGLTAAERADIRADAGVQLVRLLPVANTEVVRAPAGALAEKVDALNADPDVRVAEPDAPVHAMTNDSFWAALWGLENTGQTVDGAVGSPDADIDAPTAWGTSTGAGVLVAVVDTGVQLSHADLAGQVGGNPGENGGAKPTNATDDDSNGKVDDWRGWDFVSNDNTPDDGNGHGTHVSGTIAALSGNGAGISGVAPGAKVMPLRVLDNSGSGSSSNVASAFAYAGALGVKIVNASLGSDYTDTAISNAITAAPNTLFVVAAGNDGRDNDAQPTYPCNYPQANVLCVGATDSTDSRADFSNYGATSVDLFAPGVSIASTYTSSSYVYLDGTSMATPHAAGAAALVWAAHPGWTPAQVKSALMTSVDAKALLAPRSVSGGRLNAAKALGLPGDGGNGGGPGSEPSTGGGGTGGGEDTGGDDTGDDPAQQTPAPAPDDGTDDPGDDDEVEEPATPPALSLRRKGSTTLCRSGCSAKGFELRFTLTEAAPIKTTYERRVCRSRGCSYVPLARKTTAGRAGTNTVKVTTRVGSKRLGRGQYRVTVSADTAAGRRTGRTTFAVR